MKYLLLMYADETIVSKYSQEDFQAVASMQPELSGLAKTWAEILVIKIYAGFPADLLPQLL